MTNATMPTNEQLQAIADELARSVGAHGLQTAELSFHADCRFPGMTNEQFAIIQQQSAAIVATMRADYARKTWSM